MRSDEILVVTHLGVLLLGVLIGLLACRLALPHHPATSKDVLVDEQTRTSNKKRNSLRWEAVAIVIILLVSGGGVVVALALQRGDSEVNRCGTKYANALADSLEVRQTANEELQAADLRLTAALGRFLDSQTPQNEADLALAIAMKRAKYDALRRERGKNPYPAAPRVLCGDS